MCLIAAVCCPQQGAPSPTGFVMELVGMRSDGNTAILRKGDVVTIDGSGGKVYLGEMPTVIAGRRRTHAYPVYEMYV